MGFAQSGELVPCELRPFGDHKLEWKRFTHDESIVIGVDPAKVDSGKCWMIDGIRNLGSPVFASRVHFRNPMTTKVFPVGTVVDCRTHESNKAPAPRIVTTDEVWYVE